MQKSITLCLITSFQDEPKAKKLAESLKPYVDETVITVADKGGEFEWCDDFSAARNYNFSKATGDWILWLDADDELTHPELLRDLVKEAESRKLSGYFFSYKYAFDKNGNCTDEHWKAQFLKNDGHFKWMGAIHEDPIQLRQVSWAKYTGIQRIHHSGEEKHKQSYERNLRILLKEVEKNPKEPRTHFYLGRTYMASGQYAKAVESLTQYLELSGWDDERYEATLIIGRCYFLTNELDEALWWYHQAILEKEKYPDAYAQKGFLYLAQGSYEKSIINFILASQMELPDAATFFNPMTYSRDIYIGLASAYMYLGQLTNAQKAIRTALNADPKNEQAQELFRMIHHLKEKNDVAKSYVQIAKYLGNSQGVQRLLAAVPRQLADNEMILSLRNTFLPPQTWPEKSIAVYCGSTVESWVPGSENSKGIGGSETAVIELTKRLAKKGWKVTVFNSCDAPPEGLEIEGVKWMNYWTFNVNDKFDVLWVWRTPELFDYELDARFKLLDLHDTMTPADLSPERVARMDKIFVKTKYHRSLFPEVADEKFTVIGNGINLERFAKKVKKNPFKFIYSSTPNRGLDIVLKMWGKIKAALPEAELHVFYGWKTFYELEKNNPERMAWMKKLQANMNQPGVIDHGRVGQDELAKHQLESSFWLYPTYFPEIDCITVKEMQAAGVVPITSGFAALEERQLSGIKLPGDVHDPKWQETFVETVLSTKWEDVSPVASEFAWDKVADEWNELCE